MPSAHQTINVVTAFASPGCGCGCECCDVTDMPDMLYRIEHEGAEWITDRHLLLRRDYLDMVSERFSGGLLNVPRPVDREAHITDMFGWVKVSDEPSPRMFQGRFLDAVEGAGLRVRPTDHDDIHGVYTSGGDRVGMLMPIAAGADAETLRHMRARLAAAAL